MAFVDDPVVSRLVRLLAEDHGKMTSAEELDFCVAALAMIAFDQRWYGLMQLCLPLLFDPPEFMREDFGQTDDDQVAYMLAFGHRISDALHLKIHDRAAMADRLREVQRPARLWNIPRTDRWVSPDTVRELLDDIRSKARSMKVARAHAWTASLLRKRCASLNARMLHATDMQLARHSMATGLQWHRLAKSSQVQSIQIRIHYAASYLSVALRVGNVAKTKRFLLQPWVANFLADEERGHLDRHFGLNFVSVMVFRLLIALRDRVDIDQVQPMLQLLYARLFGELLDHPDVQREIAALDEHPTMVVTAYGAFAQLPFAALHDGEHYLAERFNVVQATPLYAGDFTAGFIDYDAVVGGQNLNANTVRVLAGGQNLHQIENELEDLRHVAESRDLNLAIGPVDSERWTVASLRWLLDQGGIALLSGHMEASAVDATRAMVVTPEEERLAVGKALEGGVSAELVILAGCQSSGHTDWLAPNENSVVSLMRRAGADAVISTLWPVKDYVSRLYTVAVVDALASGCSRAAAHGVAQRHLMQSVATIGQMNSSERIAKRALDGDTLTATRTMDSSLDHPGFWAGFILTGAWR